MSVIACYNVSKSYGDHWAVQNLDLVVPERSIFALVGPNGAGKSSTIKMLATLLEPTAGRILIDGYDTYTDRAEVRRRIGYLPDHFTLYEDMTVTRCLDFYGSCFGLDGTTRAKRIPHLLELLDLSTKADAKIKDLSRGMKQRVGIARSLLHSPPVLLLDEPASGLDPSARVSLRKLLVRLRDEEEMTILISSHILVELNTFCDSIAIIQRGKLLEMGRIDELQERLGHGQSRYTLRCFEGIDLALDRLQNIHGVQHIERSGDQLKFLFSPSDERSASLLSDLVQNGVRVTELQRGSSDMEWIYASISDDRVS